MIAEDVLERGLAHLADQYDVPAGATDRIRDQLAPMTEAADEPSWRTRLHRPTKNTWMAMAAASIVVLVIVAFAVGGSNGSGDQGGAGSTAAEGGIPAPSAADSVGAPTGTGSSKSVAGQRFAAHAPAAAPVVAPRSVGTASNAGGGATTGSAANGPISPVPSVPDKVIKTGELDLQVAKGEVSSTLNKLTGLATLERGYVADSRTSEGGIAPSGEVTLRVPVAAFEDTVSRARAITGVKVLSLETSGKDVTSKYVDLTARIKALKDTRATFLTLLSKATTIGETLAVQQHITDVQTQIEQLQGQRNVLANQAALSTLTVTVDQKVMTQATPKPHHKSGLHKAVDRSVSRFVHGIEAIIGIIGPLLLVVLIVGFGWIAARFGYRVLRRRMV